MKDTRNIKVSIVVPVYNVESFIKQSLDSLVHQTLKEIEVILVDDCSTDSSGAICDVYASLNENFQVVHNTKNIKQGLSRNIGIEQATGEYITFLDPDDWIDLDFYEKLYLTAIKKNADIAKAMPIKVFRDGSRKTQFYLNRQIRKGLKTKNPLYLMFTFEHFSAIYKRELIMVNHIRYPDISNAEDNVFLLRLTYFSKKIVLVNDTFYYYRQHDQSTIANKRALYYESILQYFKLYFEFINSHELEKSHYDLVVTRAFYSVRDSYYELDQKNMGSDFKKEYFKRVLEILELYKYDQGFILDCLMLGLNFSKQTNSLTRSKGFKLVNTIFNKLGG